MKQQTMSMYAEKGPITDELLGRMDAWFRAANYLSAGQLYLLENPLLKKPLTLDMIKKKIVGHWGTVPGQNFVFVHLNRVIKRYDLDLILLSGPGHGGNFYIANDYLDGTYSEVYPNISQDEAGMQKLFKQFSFPGGVPSHCAPETPGSINEGGELGYGIAHAFGAVFDNPGLIAAVTVGDGEAETGPLATSWQCNKFLNPITDGAVLPLRPPPSLRACPGKRSRISSTAAVGSPILWRGTIPCPCTGEWRKQWTRSLRASRTSKSTPVRPVTAAALAGR